jgi:hypothetical protein
MGIKKILLASALLLFLGLLIITLNQQPKTTGYEIISGGTTYYVSTNGNDSNPGTATAPFRTIQKCADIAQAGDTCLVAEGNYAEKVVTKRGGTATNEQACTPITGEYPNYAVNDLKNCDAKRITFKAQGSVTTTSFVIDHPFITLDGFRFTGPASKYYGYIVIYKNGNYCQILNNTVADGDTGVQGINLYTSSGQAASHCIIRNNKLSNLNYTFLVTSGNRHLIENNVFEYQNSMDYIRLFGNDILFRRNIFQLGIAKPGSGNHPDFVQTFGLPGLRSYNHVFEENWIENMDSQFSQLNNADGTINQPGATNLLYDNIHSITFRRNVIINLTLNGNIAMPNVKFENNTFYKLATQLGGISFGGSLSRGDSSNAVLKNNIFLEGGSNPTAVDGISGFYSLSGASFSTEVVAIFVTKEDISSSPIAKAITSDIQQGYLDNNGYATYKFNLLPNSSKLVLSTTYIPYKEQIYQVIKTAANNRALTTDDLSFLPNNSSKSNLLIELKEGYINSNGNITIKGQEINNIDDFAIHDNYANYKNALYDYFIKTKNLNNSIINSFYANYNYVAGAASAGFPPKKTSKCDGTGKYVSFNFCELNSINGGDPKLQNINNPKGADGIPFTLDDGLKPTPDSPLCGKGENGTDIGAYNCNPNIVLAGTPQTPTTYTLSVSKAGTGSGTITGTGINCGSDCTETYANGTTITLTATPSTGSTFAGWSGACTGTSTCTTTVNNNVSVVAVFNLIESNNPIIKYSYTLEPKWNLYSLPGIINIDSSNCNNSKLVYAEYDKTAKKFVRITEPQPGKTYWVYNKGEKCTTTTTILNPTKIEQLPNLTQGWNFVAVIPDLNNKKANQLGNCMIKATMQYNPTTKTWTDITNNTINNTLLGTAIAIYTNNDCKIG